MFLSAVPLNRIQQRLLILAFAASLPASCAIAQDDLIIESGPSGKNNQWYQEIQGKWMDSRIPALVAKSMAPGLSAPDICVTRKTVFSGPNIDTTGPARARFAPSFSAAGHYHVYATWPRGANANQVTYDIKHASGTAHKTVVQNGWGAPGSPCNAGVWVPLGDYNFEAGNQNYVEVSVDDNVQLLEPNWYGQMYADAVRFTKAPLEDLGRPIPPQSPPLWPGNEPPTDMAVAPLKWQEDFEAARAEAARSKKRLLMYFTSPDAYLDHFEKMFQDPTIQGIIQNDYVAVRLDMTKYDKLARQLNIFRAGSITVFDSKGQPLGVFTQPSTPPTFATKLRGL